MDLPFEQIRRVKNFESGYGCIGTIDIVVTKCSICGEIKKCLYIDGSEREYDGGAICLCCAIRELSI